MSLEQTFVADVEKILHPIKEAVEAAVTAATADFATEKTAIAAEIRAALPGVEAVAQAAAKDVVAAVEAALAARGL